MAMLKVKSMDGDVFDVDADTLKLSQTIKTMLNDLGWEEGDTEHIPLNSISSEVLRKVIVWCEYHKNDPVVTEQDGGKEKRTDDIPTWDAEFLRVDQGTLFEIILAANFLDIKGLTDVTCKAVANMIKGKSPEEIRKQFGIQNDLTLKEEEQINRENAWAED